MTEIAGGVSAQNFVTLSLASSSINLDTTVAMTITISDDGSGGLAASSSGCTWRNMEGIATAPASWLLPHAVFYAPAAAMASG